MNNDQAKQKSKAITRKCKSYNYPLYEELKQLFQWDLISSEEFIERHIKAAKKAKV